MNSSPTERTPAEAPIHRADLVIAWIGALLLLALHLLPAPTRILPESWLPPELLFRVAWLGLAWVYLLFFCARIWRDDP